MEMSGLLPALASLFPRGKEKSRCHMNRRLNWPLIWFGRCGEEKV